uniref:F-box/LRR-repeat protein 15/At3g58940/PEG3-like LRR domain-containing protein n=1 Tax=Aegilops tauschii subsp. strangulata TaxID=200361 RepID=A0A453PH51_AEGTS
MFTTSISDGDLDYMLACSPALEKLAFVLSCTPDLIHLRSRSLRCVLLWIFLADEVAVVDAPLLERLFLLEAPRGEGAESTMMIKIAHAPKLQVLGFLEPGFHRLQIGDNVIEPGTKPSPSTVLPSVKILAFKVNFGVIEDVKMLVAYLRCFPNIETLHIEVNQSAPCIYSVGYLALIPLFISTGNYCFLHYPSLINHLLI